MVITNFKKNVIVDGEVTTKDVQVATYEGPDDLGEMKELLGEKSRLDKINTISRRRCFRPKWSFMVPETTKERPKVFRLLKDVIKVERLIENPVPTVTISITSEGQVSISCSVDATIYYTTDGTDPTDSSTLYEESFPVDDGTTVKAIGYYVEEEETKTTSIASKKYEATPVPVAPAVPEIKFNNNGVVTITCETEGADIFYSTGTADPSTGTKYTGNFTVTNGTRVNAIAKNGDLFSDAVSETYTAPIIVTVDDPVISINDAGVVTITCATYGASIFYTTNGDDPTISSTPYSGIFSVNDGETVKAIAALDEAVSGIVSQTYTAPVIVPETPVISFDDNGLTTITATAGDAIYFTTDGTKPTINMENMYTEPFDVNNGTTVKAIAVRNEVESEVASQTYTAGAVNAPSISIAEDGTVTISNTTAGATIYYTTDGNDPTTSSTVYEGTFTATVGQTVKAIAYKNEVTSTVASATYNPSAPAVPVISISQMGSVTITCETSGASIYYTINGVDPTEESTLYNGAFNVNDNDVIRAKAFKYGVGSQGAQQTYTAPTLATPTIAPDSASIGYGNIITISAAEGSTIYYTTDGTAPDENSASHATPVTITVEQDNSIEIQAFAKKAGYRDSAVANKTYSVTLPKLGSPTFSVESGAVTIGTQVEITAPLGSGASVKYKLDSGTEYIDYAGPITINGVTTISAISVKEHCENSDPAIATYTIAKVATPTADPNGGTIAQGGTVTLNCSTTGATIYYTNDGSAPSSSSTEYTTPIVINVATTIKAIAVMANMTDSDVMIKEFAVDLPDCATPTFSQAAGEISKGTQVTISSDTLGADIYYTNDGSVPTTSSTLYSGAITVNSSVTLKAIAVKSGFDNSAVATVAYTVPKVATPVIQPSETSHTGSVEVTITTSTDSATIYYTDDGTTPDSSSTQYTAPFTITATSSNVTKTIQAIAVKSGSIDSEVASKTYTVAKPATTLYKYYGIYDETDDGTGQNVDPDYDLTQETIDSIFTSFAEVEDLVYNDSGAAVKTVATSRVMGDSTHEVGAQGGAGEGVGCRVVYMYPAEFGDLTGATQNGFAYNLNDLTKLTVTIEDIPYFVYVTGIVGNNRTFPFSFS